MEPLNAAVAYYLTGIMVVLGLISFVGYQRQQRQQRNDKK